MSRNDTKLQGRLVRACRTSDEMMQSLSASQRSRLHHLHLAIAGGPAADHRLLCAEDRILTLIEWSHHAHRLDFLKTAIELARLHRAELDWDDLAEWSDRLNLDWAIPRLRDAAHLA